MNLVKPPYQRTLSLYVDDHTSYCEVKKTSKIDSIKQNWQEITRCFGFDEGIHIQDLNDGTLTIVTLSGSWLVMILNQVETDGTMYMFDEVESFINEFEDENEHNWIPALKSSLKKAKPVKVPIEIVYHSARPLLYIA